ncbi:MAG TPA: hypothetical protein DEQ30_05905 [Porphyromonadaceae bacterium]|nr:hypothetical protein [Porphyromonadaceae bacterium]
MKNLFLLIFMLFSAGVPVVCAQTNASDTIVAGNNVRFGVKLGGQISAVSNIHGGSNKRFPGLTIGASMPILISDEKINRFYVVPELLYSQKGERSRTNENKQIDYYCDYISLPVLLKAYTLDNDLFYIEIGPEVSYLIHQKNKRLDLGEARKFDVGLCLGGGVNIGGEHKFELGARLNWGLMDIYPDVKGRNNTIGGAIALSYFFGEKRVKK